MTQECASSKQTRTGSSDCSWKIHLEHPRVTPPCMQTRAGSSDCQLAADDRLAAAWLCRMQRCDMWNPFDQQQLTTGWQLVTGWQLPCCAAYKGMKCGDQIDSSSDSCTSRWERYCRNGILHAGHVLLLLLLLTSRCVRSAAAIALRSEFNPISAGRMVEAAGLADYITSLSAEVIIVNSAAINRSCWKSACLYWL